MLQGAIQGLIAQYKIYMKLMKYKPQYYIVVHNIQLCCAICQDI